MLLQQLHGIFLALCQKADTPRSLAAWLLFREKEYEQLVDLTTDPFHYQQHEAYRFSLDRAVTDFFSKFRDFDLKGVDLEADCRRSFFKDEEQCAKTNARLSPFLYNGPFRDLGDLEIAESLRELKEMMSELLGRIPLELESARFGPGATFGDKGRLTTVPDKMTSRLTTTRNAWHLAPLWERTAWARAVFNGPQSSPLFTQGNRFTTVPKSAKKLRGIAIEPSLNVFYQLGVGAFIRRRLRRFGIDLDFGQEKHRKLAASASQSGSHSTIDLSSASDNVSTRLVQLLVPPQWWDLLCTLRSPKTFIDGKWVYLNKFSSMGNGFTFELETAIFFCIAKLACRKAGCEPDVLVYGDDIIVPTAAGKLCCSLLRFLGFRPNPKKTFLTGVFRESCGGDFFNGRAVRPFYLKELPREPQQTMSLINGLGRLSQSADGSFIRYCFSSRARALAIETLPVNLRKLRGPECLGDVVIYDDDVNTWQISFHNGIRYVRAYLPVSSLLPFHHWRPDVVLASALYGVSGDGVSSRDAVSGYAIKRIAYS
jgi:hypothetical protein